MSSIDDLKKRLELLLYEFGDSMRESGKKMKDFQISLTETQKVLQDTRTKLDKQILAYQADLDNVKNFIITKFDTVKPQYVAEVQMVIDSKLKAIYESIMAKIREIKWEKAETQKIVEEMAGLRDNLRHTKQQFDIKTKHIQETIESTMQFLQKEVQDRSNAVNNLTKQLQEYKKLVDQVNSALQQKPDKDELKTLLSGKADVLTLNNWIKQHTSTLNTILDKKGNLEDICLLKDQIKTKVNQETLDAEIVKLRQLIVELKSPEYISTVAERVKKVINSQESITELQKTISSINKKLSDKIDRGDMLRELAKIENLVISRKGEAQEAKMALSQLAQKVNTSDFNTAIENLRNEMKQIKSTPDMKAITALVNSQINEHLCQLQRSVQQLLLLHAKLETRLKK